MIQLVFFSGKITTLPLCDQSTIRGHGANEGRGHGTNQRPLSGGALVKGKRQSNSALAVVFLPPGSWVMFAGTEKGDR